MSKGLSAAANVTQPLEPFAKILIKDALSWASAARRRGAQSRLAVSLGPRQSLSKKPNITRIAAERPLDKRPEALSGAVWLPRYSVQGGLM